MTFKQKHEKLITSSGGEVSQGNWVIRPGIMITNKTSQTHQFQNLLEDFNINVTGDEYLTNAEFDGRLTYLSFKDQPSDCSEFNKNLQDVGHLSVYNQTYVTFLISGVSLEACLEFTAHSEAKIARLTSSKTKSQNDPLYVVFDENEISYLKEVQELKRKYNFQNEELCNSLNSSRKAISFTVTMSLKDWHKTMIGRISPHGVEKEVLGIFQEVNQKLRFWYPEFIKTYEEYWEMNNSKKYE